MDANRHDQVPLRPDFEDVAGGLIDGARDGGTGGAISVWTGAPLGSGFLVEKSGTRWDFFFIGVISVAVDPKYTENPHVPHGLTVNADVVAWNRRAPVAIALASCIAAAACGDGSQNAGASGTTHRGDTTVIVTPADGVWGPLHDAVEEFRVPGTRKETTFGQISALAATSSGGVLLYDVKAAEGMILRQFDSTGAFVRNIGREGAGPGEYSSDQLAIVESDGTITVRDFIRAIMSYGADGRYVTGFPIGFSPGAMDLSVSSDGSIFTTATRTTEHPRPGQRVAPTMYHYDRTGRLLDSAIGSPWLAPRDPSKAHSRYEPHELRRALSDGRLIIIRTDKLGFLVIDPGGKRPPMIVERSAPPIPYPDGELQELRAGEKAEILFEGERIKNPVAAAEVPKFKLPLQSMLTDNDGRVWLTKVGPSSKTAPHCSSTVNDQCVATGTYRQHLTYLAFQTDGTFLGEIRFPFGARPAFSGDHAWAIVRDSDDIPVLVKYRLHK